MAPPKSNSTISSTHNEDRRHRSGRQTPERNVILRTTLREAHWRPRALRVLVPVCLAAAVLTGCGRLGDRLVRRALPEGAPREKQIVRELAANQAKLESLRAAGSCVVASPEFAAKKRFRGVVAWLRPERFHITGRRMAVPVFELAVSGRDYLLETEQERFYRLGEAASGTRPFSVHPADLLNEIFFPEDWRSLSLWREVRLVDYLPDEGVAVLEIGHAGHPRRRLHLEGAPWVVRRNVRLDEEGGVLAETVMEDYRVVNGVRFPGRVACVFPREETSLDVDFDRIEINLPLDRGLFEINL